VCVCVCVSAIQIRVDSQDHVGDWMKLGVTVLSVFKKGKEKIRRGEELIWIPATDFRCRCPARLRVRHTYLVIGNEVVGASRPGLIVDRSSSAHKWREQLARRLRRSIQRCWTSTVTVRRPPLLCICRSILETVQRNHWRRRWRRRRISDWVQSFGVALLELQTGTSA